jgi:hypothetical protein
MEGRISHYILQVHICLVLDEVCNNAVIAVFGSQHLDCAHEWRHTRLGLRTKRLISPCLTIALICFSRPHAALGRQGSCMYYTCIDCSYVSGDQLRYDVPLPVHSRPRQEQSAFLPPCSTPCGMRRVGVALSPCTALSFQRSVQLWALHVRLWSWQPLHHRPQCVLA